MRGSGRGTSLEEDAEFGEGGHGFAARLQRHAEIEMPHRVGGVAHGQLTIHTRGIGKTLFTHRLRALAGERGDVLQKQQWRKKPDQSNHGSTFSV